MWSFFPKKSKRKTFEKLIGLMLVFNEIDIIEQTLNYGINQGVEFVIMDNGSTDGSFEICQKYLGKGVLKIERIFTKNFALDFLLKKIYKLAMTFDPDWLILWDADVFLESPFKNKKLKDSVKKVASDGYNCIQFNNFEFWPTKKDSQSADVRKRMKYYTWNDDFRLLCWKAGRGVRNINAHTLNLKHPKIYPVKFIMRHYKIRSFEQGLRKVFEERLPRFFNQPPGWHVHYNLMKKEKKYFIIDKAKLTKYHEDGIWNLERKFDGWQTPMPDLRNRENER